MTCKYAEKTVLLKPSSYRIPNQGFFSGKESIKTGIWRKKTIFAKNFEQWEKEIEEHAEEKFSEELTV